MSRATELADEADTLVRLHKSSGLGMDPDAAAGLLERQAAELRRLERVNAELVNEMEWVRGYISRYDPPGLPNHLAQRIDAALTSATKEQQK